MLLLLLSLLLLHVLHVTALLDQAQLPHLVRLLVPVGIASGVAGQISQFLTHRPGQTYQLIQIMAFQLRIFLINLKNLVRGLPGQHHCTQVNEHRQAHGVYELILFAILGVRRLIGVQKNRIPNKQRVHQSKLPSMHTPDPPQQKSFRLHILQLQHPEQLQISGF